MRIYHVVAVRGEQHALQPLPLIVLNVRAFHTAAHARLSWSIRPCRSSCATIAPSPSLTFTRSAVLYSHRLPLTHQG